MTLHIETSFKIRQFGSREENKKKRCGDDAGWLRERLGRAAFTTAKLNRNQHMLLYRLCFFWVSFLLSHIHTWLQMLCVWRREKWKVMVLYSLHTRHLIVLHLLLFSVAQMQYPIPHTLVSLIPEAMWNMIVKQCYTKLKYNSIPHKHARLIRPWSGLWDTTIQSLSLTLILILQHLFIPWEKVSIATPHPSSRSMSSGTRWQERAWHCNFFHLQNTHTSIYCFKTSLHKHIQPKLIFLKPLRNMVIQMSLFSLFI